MLGALGMIVSAGMNYGSKGMLRVSDDTSGARSAGSGLVGIHWTRFVEFGSGGRRGLLSFVELLGGV